MHSTHSPRTPPGVHRLRLSFALLLFASSWVPAESSVWKAQKDNAVIYLGATFHFLRASDYPLPPEFNAAYDASDRLVFETDIGKLQDPATQQKLLAAAVYTNGTTIKQHLSPKAYAQLSAYCESNSIPLDAFTQFKPSMLMVTLTFMELMKLGITQQGVDLFFHGRARKDNKAVEGLETVEQQLDYVLTMADGHEDDFVMHSLNDMATARQQFETLAEAWRKGDGETLSATLVADLKTKLPKLYKKLITDRNQAWLPLIDAHRKSPGTEFILVGAAHLVGPDGIVEALKLMGYQVDKL